MIYNFGQEYFGIFPYYSYRTTQHIYIMYSTGWSHNGSEKINAYSHLYKLTCNYGTMYHGILSNSKKIPYSTVTLQQINYRVDIVVTFKWRINLTTTGIRLLCIGHNLLREINISNTLRIEKCLSPAGIILFCVGLKLFREISISNTLRIEKCLSR